MQAVAAAPKPLAGHAAALYRQAQQGKFFDEAGKLDPEILPTSDGESFLVAWKSKPGATRWIVTLHGTQGFATDDLALWSRNLNDRNVGVLCVQWWLGSGNASGSYYSPAQTYREIDLALTSLHVMPGDALLHGFSRGAAASYALAAMDAGRGGHRYFSLIVASSGGVGLDYPPTRAILEGTYGPRPLQGTHWITAAGGRDPNPDRDGIPAMRRTAAWLQEQGATVAASIEDPAAGHGALQFNGNVRRVLDLFLDQPK